MDNSPLFREMGRIVRPHGVTGELKIAPETDDPTRFQNLKAVFVGSNVESATSFDILSVRLQPSKYGITVLVKLAGVDSREDAEKLNKLTVFALEDDLPALEEGEYFFSDLIGLMVSTPEKKGIGTVSEIIEKFGQNLLVVSRPGEADVMIPMVDEFIMELDFDRKEVIIDPVEGLL